MPGYALHFEQEWRHGSEDEGRGNGAGQAGLWAKRIAQWERSGRTQRAFCEERGWALSMLQYWRARLKHTAAQPAAPRPAFVPLTLSEPQGGALEIVLRSGTRVRLEGAVAARLAEALLGRLK